MSVRRLTIIALSAVMLTALLGTAPNASAAVGELELTAPARVNAGARVALRITVTGAPAGSSVTVSRRPYPFRAATAVATVAVSPNQTVSVIVHPDRSTRYVASLAGRAVQALVRVRGRLLVKLRALSLGRAAVSLVIFHPHDLRWGGARVRWFFAGRTGRFRSEPGTRTHRLSGSVAVARTIVTLPAGRYRFRACVFVPEARALIDPARALSCAGRAYAGAASLPVGFPTPAAVARGTRYLSRRIGHTGLAVIDSEGRLSGVNLRTQFISASVVKAMLLVAYLRRLRALGHRQMDGASDAFLYPMIHVSDNAAAFVTQSYVGDAGLYAVARAAGMTDFSVAGPWTSALLTPADQARFFFAMDALIPAPFRAYANRLLSTIAAYESWGIPAIARPAGYRVFFKGGWRPTPSGQLVNQMARLQGHHRTFAIAVMTDGDPSMLYGEQTLQGLTATLLR